MVVGATAVAVHSPVTSDKVGTTGSVSSSTVTAKVQAEVLPLPSSAVKVTVVLPVTTVADNGDWVRLTAPQLSLDIANEV